jgi:hypothetical protein
MYRFKPTNNKANIITSIYLYVRKKCKLSFEVL